MDDGKTYIGKTKNDFEVYVDMHDSHAATHLADTPELFDLVEEVLPQLEPAEEYARFEIDMGRIIGTTDLCDTADGDEIVYAKRQNRDIYTRFVKNKKPGPTQWIVVQLDKTEHNTYDLFTAFTGRLTPPFPGDEFETAEGRAFWATHALAWGTQEIIPGTETTECPW